jgi:hypothetical protein
MNENVLRFILNYLYSDEAVFPCKGQCGIFNESVAGLTDALPDADISVDSFLQFAFDVMGAAVGRYNLA